MEDILDIVKIFLREDEIKELSIRYSIQYVKYYHNKKFGLSTILFAGFNVEEMNRLSQIARVNNLSVSSKISENLIFLCTNSNIRSERIQKAKEYGATILSREDFERLFAKDDYKLYESKLVYDPTVSTDYNIAQPLSNFDEEIKVKSFSLDNDEIYLVNLYAMTCTCQDFEKKDRVLFSKGDIRRLCKHLIFEYKSRFGLIGLSDFKRYILQSGRPIKENLKYIHVDNIDTPVIINLDKPNDWWDIFILNKSEYTRYSYHPIEERFSYNEKPYGHVTQLRNKLKELQADLGIIGKSAKSSNSSQVAQYKTQSIINNISTKYPSQFEYKKPLGCTVPVILIIIAVLLYLFFK